MFQANTNPSAAPRPPAPANANALQQTGPLSAHTGCSIPVAPAPAIAVPSPSPASVSAGVNLPAYPRSTGSGAPAAAAAGASAPAAAGRRPQQEHATAPPPRAPAPMPPPLKSHNSGGGAGGCGIISLAPLPPLTQAAPSTTLPKAPLASRLPTRAAAHSSSGNAVAAPLPIPRAPPLSSSSSAASGGASTSLPTPLPRSNVFGGGGASTSGARRMLPMPKPAARSSINLGSPDGKFPSSTPLMAPNTSATSSKLPLTPPIPAAAAAASPSPSTSGVTSSSPAAPSSTIPLPVPRPLLSKLPPPTRAIPSQPTPLPSASTSRPAAAASALPLPLPNVLSPPQTTSPPAPPPMTTFNMSTGTAAASITSGTTLNSSPRNPPQRALPLPHPRKPTTNSLTSPPMSLHRPPSHTPSLPLPTPVASLHRPTPPVISATSAAAMSSSPQPTPPLLPSPNPSPILPPTIMASAEPLRGGGGSSLHSTPLRSPAMSPISPSFTPSASTGGHATGGGMSSPAFTPRTSAMQYGTGGGQHAHQQYSHHAHHNGGHGHSPLHGRASVRTMALKRNRPRSNTEPMAVYPTEEMVKFRRKIRKNDREKQRRSELNNKFDALSDLLQLGRKSKTEKAVILSEAIKEIKMLRAKLDEIGMGGVVPPPPAGDASTYGTTDNVMDSPHMSHMNSMQDLPDAHMNPEYSHFSTTGLANALPSTESESSPLGVAPASCSSEPASPVVSHRHAEEAASASPGSYYQSVSSSAPHRLQGSGLTRNPDSRAFDGATRGHYRVASVTTERESVRTRSQRAISRRTGSLGGANRSLSPLSGPTSNPSAHHQYQDASSSSAAGDGGNDSSRIVATVELPSVNSSTESAQRSDRSFGTSFSSASASGFNSSSGHFLSRPSPPSDRSLSLTGSPRITRQRARLLERSSSHSMAGALDTAMDTASAMIDSPPDDESLFVFNEQPKTLEKDIEIDFSVKHTDVSESSAPAMGHLHRAASDPYPHSGGGACGDAQQQQHQLTNPEVIRPEHVEPLGGFDSRTQSLSSTTSPAGQSEPYLMLENTSGTLDTVSSPEISVTSSHDGIDRSGLRRRSGVGITPNRARESTSASSLDDFSYDVTDGHLTHGESDSLKINSLKFSSVDMSVTQDTQMTEMFGVSSASTNMKLEGVTMTAGSSTNAAMLSGISHSMGDADGDAGGDAGMDDDDVFGQSHMMVDDHEHTNIFTAEVY